MTLVNGNLLSPLAQIVFLVGIGVMARRTRLISEAGTHSLTEVVMNITLPPMLFISALQSDLDVIIRQGPWVALAGLVFPLLGFVVSAGVARLFTLPRRQASVVRVSGAVCNTAFVGIPVCAALWGPTGALLAAIYDQTLTLPVLALPAIEYGHAEKGKIWRTFLLAPMLWGLLLGIAGRIIGLTLPEWLFAPLSMLGNATLPLALVLVGTLVIPARLTAGLGRSLGAFVVARLIAAPMIALAVLLVLGAKGTSAGVMLLQAAMPASVLATVMAKEYGADATLAATGAVATYIFALITIPLLSIIALRM